MGQLVGQLGRGARGVQRHADGAEPDDGEVADGEVRAVAAHQRDAVSLSDAQPGQAAAQRGDIVPELAVGDGSTMGDECRGVVGMRVDDGGQVHAGRPPGELAGPDTTVPHGHRPWPGTTSAQQEQLHDAGHEERHQQQGEGEGGRGPHGRRGYRPIRGGRRRAARAARPRRAGRRSLGLALPATHGVRRIAGRTPAWRRRVGRVVQPGQAHLVARAEVQLVGGRPPVEAHGQEPVGVDHQPDAAADPRRSEPTTAPVRTVSPNRSRIWSPQPSTSSGPTFSWALPKRSTQSTSPTSSPPSSRDTGTTWGSSGHGVDRLAQLGEVDAVAEVGGDGGEHVPAGERRARCGQVVARCR